MTPLRALLIEDSEDDALLLQRELEAGGFALTYTRVDNAADLQRALDEREWDIALSDYSMPQFSALDALAIVQSSRQVDLPFVVVSGSIGEASAVGALKAGAANYVMKGALGGLLPVVQRELKDAQIRRERHDAFVALEHAVRARDEFLSIASHELKTPVTALELQAQSLLQLAATERGPLLAHDQVIRRLDSISRNADRLAQLIDRLLDISRVTAGRLRLVRDDIDLVQVTRRAVARMDEALRIAECDVTIAGPAQVLGFWDGDRIDTVVTNLLTNAAKYGAHKPVRIEIEDGDSVARLRVIDNGIGISPEDQNRIFERFERAVPEKHYGGFGVGLWLAQQIVHAHGGSIETRSEPGAGSTFTVTLPKRGSA